MEREIVDLKIAGNFHGGLDHARDEELWKDLYQHVGRLIADPKYQPLHLMLFANSVG